MYLKNLPSYFRHAAKIANKSPHPRYKIGAAILDKNRRLVVSGYNQFKTHTVTHGPQTLHAELHALSRLNNRKQVGDCVLVIYRRTNTGFGLSRPCRNCLSVLKLAGITKIEYTNNEEGYSVETIN